MMAPAYVVLGALLFAMGLYGIFARRNVVLKLVAVNIAASGVFLLMVSAAPPMPDGGTDPLPQALVLTGIVISVAVTAFALALVRRLAERENGRVTLDTDDDAP